MNSFKIYKQDKPGEWYHVVRERCEAGNTDEALNNFINLRHLRNADQSGNYLIESLTCNTIAHFTVRPNQPSYVIESN